MKARFVIGIILAALLLLMQYRLWIADDSWPDAWSLHKQVAAQKAKNSQLKSRNHDLAAEVHDLKRGHNAIEARARKELGMVKKGETFYEIIRPAKARRASGPPPKDREKQGASAASDEQNRGRRPLLQDK
jgi:cell division protein FtsB